MSFKITGRDELQKQLDEASKAFQALDGELTTLQFNPASPSSMEAAVVQMEQAIDAKIGPYRGNAMVESIAEELKQKYRQEIFDRAASARLQKETEP